MKLRIWPEPTAAERTAIERALATLLLRLRGQRTHSRWRDEGVKENTQEEPTLPEKRAAAPASARDSA